jgi:hypothetical protein
VNDNRIRHHLPGKGCANAGAAHDIEGERGNKNKVREAGQRPGLKVETRTGDVAEGHQQEHRREHVEEDRQQSRHIALHTTDRANTESTPFRRFGICGTVFNQALCGEKKGFSFLIPTNIIRRLRVVGDNRATLRSQRAVGRLSPDVVMQAPTILAPVALPDRSAADR